MIPRSNLVLAGAIALSGCFVDGEYVYENESQAAIRVTVPPPAVRYEAPLACGYNSIYVQGHWHWNGARWFWRHGRCIRNRTDYSYVRPYWNGGVYYRGYWAPQGRPPARYYAPRGGYVPPPAPAAPSPGYVPPPPPSR